MKKNTLSALVKYLTEKNDDYMMDIKDELEAELNRDAEEKAAKAAEYEAAWTIVRQFMADNDIFLPAGEIYVQIENDLPEGFSLNKVTYGLTHYWKDFVEKGTIGKTSAYRLIK